jgi:hypothetical protein
LRVRNHAETAGYQRPDQRSLGTRVNDAIAVRAAFEVEERGSVTDRSAIVVSLSRRAWRESGTAAARRNANTDELGGPR